MSATRKRFDEDPYLGHCTATVVAASAEGIELDETVCYARSGGQAGDTATLALATGARWPSSTPSTLRTAAASCMCPHRMRRCRAWASASP